MSQKTALFYKNIIRNAKLRKLTSVYFFKKKFSSDMQLCKPTFPSVCLSVFVCYAEMYQKNALFYKNIIRNDKLRKLTFEDFFNFLAATCISVSHTFRPSVCESVCYADMSHKNALFYKNIIRKDKLRKLTFEDFFNLFFTLFYIMKLYLRKYFDSLPFFFKCPKWTRSQLWDVSYVLVFLVARLKIGDLCFWVRWLVG